MPSIRKRNGRYQVQVRREGHSPISKTFKRLRDAQEWARQKEAEADRGDLGPRKVSLNEIRLGCLIKRYINEVVPKKQGSRDETIVLRAFRQHPICKRKLSAITTSDFAKYRDERLKEIQPVTLKRQLNPIRHMFEVARDEWGIPIRENPLAKLKLKATDNRRERRLKDGELADPLHSDIHQNYRCENR